MGWMRKRPSSRAFERQSSVRRQLLTAGAMSLAGLGLAAVRKGRAAILEENQRAAQPKTPVARGAILVGCIL